MAAPALAKTPTVELETRVDEWLARAAANGIALAALLCLTTWLLIRYTAADPDLFARVAMGKLIAISGSVPIHDPFGYTPRRPLWIDHEWLSGVIFYWLLRAGGDPLLFSFKLLIAGCSIAALWRAHVIAWSRHASIALFAVASFQLITAWQSPIRCQAFTYCFLSILLLGIADAMHRGRRWLAWTAPVLMVVWANAHGGFVLGLFVYGLFAAEQWRTSSPYCRAYTVSWLACLAGTCINPYGPLTYWKYIVEAITMKRPGIAEWAALNPLSSNAIIPDFFLVMVGVALWLSLKKARAVQRLVRFDVVVILFGAIEAYRHLRLVPVFLMATIVFGYPLLKSLWEDIPDYLAVTGQKFARATLLVFALSLPYQLIVIGQFFVSLPAFTMVYGYYPQSGVKWLLENEAGGNILVPFTSGSYALQQLYPRFHVSVDGRYEETYTNETVKLALDAEAAKSPTRMQSVRALNPDFILADTASLVSHPYAAPWQAIYVDESYTVLAKRPGAIAARGVQKALVHDWQAEAAPWPK